MLQPVPARALLAASVLLATAALPRCAAQDHVYVADGRIVSGRLVEGGDGADATVRIVVEGRGEIRLRAVEVVAIERERPAREVFVVTERDPDRLLAAADRFSRTGDRALEAAMEDSETKEDPDARRALRLEQAQQAYDRAMVCLFRIVELYPDREADLEAKMTAVQASLSMTRKLTVLPTEAAPGATGEAPEGEEKAPGEGGGAPGTPADSEEARAGEH